MLIEEYLQMRIQSAGSILAGEELAGNVPKAMAEKAAIAELRGVEAFLNNASKSSEVANDSTSPNTQIMPYANCTRCYWHNHCVLHFDSHVCRVKRELRTA